MSVFNAGFDPNGRPVHVRFEKGGRFDLGRELEAVEAKRPLVLTTPEQTEQGEEIVAALKGSAVGLYSRATMHTPVDITRDALETVKKSNADCLIAIGGGSTIGLGKAIAYHTDLPQIVLPTTYAGSEATPVLGQTENGVKSTLKSARVQPEAIVYDAELVRSLPVAMSVTSGLNAMAHAVEALYARDANRLSSELALSGLRAFVTGLPTVVSTPDDLVAREDTLFGAWTCGAVLAQVGMALHHKLCHTLGGTLNLPHAATHAILLPHATAYNEAAAFDALAPLAAILGSKTVGGGLFDFARQLGAPTDLKSLGVSEADLDKVADLAAQNPYWNPVAIEREAIRALLQNAYDGVRPKTGGK
jgi:maleylacetate reductase